MGLNEKRGRTMEHICPYCEKQTIVKKVAKQEEYTVRGEKIIVPAEYFVCSVCQEDFDDPLSKQDPVELAYKEYRKLKNMIQPEEIRAFRKRFGLTQKELSTLLGWGGATLSRYENGALQDDSHETTLQLVINEPLNLIKLIDKVPSALTPGKKEKLVQGLEDYKLGHNTMREFFENTFTTYSPGIESGFKKLDIAKLFNIILFFCDGGVLKTKLNKLLFYVDFKYFKEYSTSITGVRYAKYPFGPVPDHYGYYFALLSNDEEQAISVDEIQIGQFIGEIFYSIRKPDLSLFSEHEVKTMEFIKDYFKDFNVTSISDASHKEKGYIDTNNKAFISYENADYLSI